MTNTPSTKEPATREEYLALAKESVRLARDPIHARINEVVGMLDRYENAHPDEPRFADLLEESFNDPDCLCPTDISCPLHGRGRHG